ncbi:sensor histidine kinase [Paenibacillus sp. FSL H8-0034]|uniref:sensor histidine kinase n=1 Tax=Paenibacillus sp. FSL H8-0034 TaxID=2954671 RepID=UPI0030FAB515
METKSSSIEKMVDAVLSASNLIGQDNRINEMIKQYEDRELTAFNRNQLTQEMIRKLTDVKNYILPGEGEITLIDTRGAIYSTASLTDSRSIPEIQDMDWYKKTVQMNGHVNWFATKRNTDFAEKDKSYFSMARVLKFGYADSLQLVLLIHMRTSAFLSTQEIKQDFGNPFYLSSNSGTIYISNDENWIGQQLPTELLKASMDRQETAIQLIGQPSYAMGYKLPNFDWKLIMLYDQSLLKDRLSQAQNSLFLISGLFAALFIILMFFFSMMITKPLSKLAHSIQVLDSGNLEVRVLLSGAYEIKLLTKHFNQMVLRLRDSIERNKVERRKKEIARFQALQAQINPHFLFNTLNTIKWTAYMSEAPHVAEMVSKLGRLLEKSFQQHGDLVTIREEVEHLELYLDLQNMRFNNNYTLHLEMPDFLMEKCVPKLTLQPIVENSIRHGFEDGSVQGEIRLKGNIEGTSFQLVIEDNGAGMKSQSTELLLEHSEGPAEFQFSGIGLKNVHDRIQLHYGKEYGLSISSQIGVGTAVSILLPLKGADEEHA